MIVPNYDIVIFVTINCFMRIFLYFILVSVLFSCNETNKQPEKLTIDALYKKYPDSVPILIQHGNKSFKRYDYDKALEDGAKAYRMQPNNLEARKLYANALNNRAERTATDVRNAQDHFKFILKKDPKNTEVLVALASTFAQQGDNEKAFQFINEALHVAKRYRDAYTMKGSIYLSMGNLKLAKSSYQTAIDQDPDFFEAYLRLGLIYQGENDPLCIEYFLTATSLRPYSLDAHYNLAYAYQQFNKDDLALETYRKMGRLDKEFTPSMFQQGWIKQFHQNDVDSAIYFYNMTLQKEPRYVEAWHNLGMCYETIGEKYDAIKCYKKAAHYNPEFEISVEALKRLSK